MEYGAHIAVLFCIFAILSLSLNLVIGYTGLISLAQAGLWGVGAYTTALALTRFHIPFLLASGVGMAITMACAWLLGIVLSRFRDDYYLFTSIGFTTIASGVFLNWESVTRGALGIPGIPKPEIFGFAFSRPIDFLVPAGIVLCMAYGVCRWITTSSFGRVLKGIREDEDALKVFGYRTEQYKLAIFVVSAGMSALAGSLYATYITFIDPAAFYLPQSVLVLSMIILGGLASLRGSLVGALFLVILPEALRFVGFSSDIAGYMRQLIYGALLVVMMMYRPQGFIGEYKL